MKKVIETLNDILIPYGKELNSKNLKIMHNALKKTVDEKLNGEFDASVSDQIFELLMLALNSIEGTNLERENAFFKTIQQFSDLNNNIIYIEKSLKKLCEFDKITTNEEGTQVFFILSLIGQAIDIYKELINNKKQEIHLSPLQKGIAGTQSTTPKKMLSPINKYDYCFLLSTEAKEVSTKLKNAFIEDPDEIAFMFSIMNQLGKDAFIVNNEEEQKRLDALYESSAFYNASKEVEIKHIYQSFKIQIASLFLPITTIRYQQIMGFKKQISKEKLANAIDDVMQYVFEINANTNPKFYDGPFQERTWYSKHPIFEKTRKGKEKIHPAFKDEDDVLQLLENFKGKLPQKLTKN